MDPQTFDGLIQRLVQTRSRRSLLGGSVLAALGLGEETRAKTRHKDHAQSKKKGRSNTATAEGQLGIGARCDPPKNRHGKKHGCNACSTDFSVAYTNAKGKTVRKCACKPPGHGATTNQAWQCCSGLSDGSQCVDPSGAVATVPPAPPPRDRPVRRVRQAPETHPRSAPPCARPARSAIRRQATAKRAH